jgi:CBS-domain-containing membrane protein
METVLIRDLRPYKPAVVVAGEMSINAMVELLLAEPLTRFLCVVDDAGTLVGLVGRKRLFRAVFSHHVSPASIVHQLYTLVTSERAADLLIRHVITVREADTLDEVIRMLIKHDLYELPVVTPDRRVLGFVTMDMLWRQWLAENERKPV